MKNNRALTMTLVTIGTFCLAAFTGYHALTATTGTEASGSSASQTVSIEAQAAETEAASTDTETETVSGTDAGTTVISTAAVSSDGLIDGTQLFTERDLTQTADLSEAVYYTVSDGETIYITEEGVYVLTGTASEAEVIVEAADEDKVQLVLDGVSITNKSTPCIYVKNADKVFVTLAEGSNNTLEVTGEFTDDGDTSTDAVIFSKDDLILNGLGSLTVNSTENGISGKDDLKITGGTYIITCVDDALEANDSICISDGDISIKTDKDGLHAENDEDDSVGYIYICGGKINIAAGDDAIHGTTIVEIDGGEISLKAAEGIEGTWIQVNDGTVSIDASDDGINAGRKSNSMQPGIEINGGYITINMGAGDTDAIDSNGNLAVNGGTLDITAQSPFDYDGTAQYNGGTIIVNGQETNAITNQMMGGGMQRGGMQNRDGGMQQGGGFGGR